MLLGLNQGPFPKNADASSITLAQKNWHFAQGAMLWCFGVVACGARRPGIDPSSSKSLFSFSYGLKWLEKIENLLI